MKMNFSRSLRLITAGTLLLAVGAIILPRVTSYVSTSAVVNAPLIIVRSPINGRIVHPSARVADSVASGAPLVRIEGDRADRSLVSELTARHRGLDAEIAALLREITTLEELSLDLRTRERRHRQHGLRWQAARMNELSAETRRAEASRQEVAQRLERTRQLVEKGGISRALLDREQAEFAAKTADVARLAAQTEAQRIDGQALQDGINLESNAGEGSYARQRLDEIAMRQADLRTRAVRAQAAFKSVEIRLADASRDLAATEVFSPASASAGVVWRASAAVGSEVLVGDEIVKIVDCDRRFIEVSVSERHFESIVPGTHAQVRLRGSTESFEATVDAVMGSGAKTDQAELSSRPPQVPAGQLRVFIQLAPADLSGRARAETAAAFCDVGRTAEVRFDRSFAGDLRLFGLALPWAGAKAEEVALAH